jgi:hypothetical protein
MSNTLYQKKPTGPVSPIAGTVSASMPENRGISGDLAEANAGGLTSVDRFNLGFSGIVDFINAGSVYTKGQFEATQVEINARLLELNKKALDRDIKDISYIAGVYASNTLKTSAELKGKQVAAQAETGFSVTETESFKAQTDYTDLLAKDQIDQYAYEAAMSIENKRNQKAAFEAEQEIKRAEAKYIRKTSKVAAGMQALSGAAKIAAGIYF